MGSFWVRHLKFLDFPPWGRISRIEIPILVGFRRNPTNSTKGRISSSVKVFRFFSFLCVVRRVVFLTGAMTTRGHEPLIHCGKVQHKTKTFSRGFAKPIARKGYGSMIGSCWPFYRNIIGLFWNI